ncbi:hypothetical protein SOVF_138260 [Spinacia oleracea]|nr:hypothetical protein SOVF_138260 [Spinacia oleracea]
MRRGVRTGSTCSGTGNRHVRVKNMESEDSDEDYVAEVDEIDDQSDELDSLVGDGSEEGSFFEAPEEEEEENEGGWRRVIKPKVKKRSTRNRGNVIKRPKKRKRVVRSDDEEESDDDNDEEFTPEEEYLEEEEEDEDEDEEEEEEEFLMLKTNTRKRGRSTSKTRTSVKSRKKGSTKVVRKPRSKKRTKTSSLRTRRRVKSDGDEDFSDKGPTSRGRSSMRKPVRGKKRATTGSDSDFCAELSDYEFTISEEEREQIREANKFCGSLAPNLRSSRRIHKDEAFYEPKKPPARKGKGKVKAEEKKNDVSIPVCGICLTEEGKNIVRGTLNCCSHYFCFACIFEWSKVETRCPLCKQRFVSISKPGRCGKGFDLRDTVMPVPERDQVYQPSEEELRDFLNPYENVICTECHQGGDDALMLLCDLCDSPAHTYCVGLGREVPDGNWYCDGCRPAALVSSHSQTQDLTPDQRTSTGVSDGTSTYENMAEIDLNVSIPETQVSQGNGFLSSPRFTGGSFQAPSPVSGMGVSTVSGRRLIHRQIRNILTTRLSQISPGPGISGLGNLIGHGVNLTQQQSRTTIDVGPSFNSSYVDRLQERHSSSVQNRDSFPGRLGHMMRQIGHPSTSANGTDHSQVNWSGLDRLNLGEGQSQIFAGEQLRPCTGRSSIVPEIGVPHSHNRYAEHAGFVKQEVQSMVRNQLRIFSQEINLGNNDYVEISRRSVHTVMAACGLEPRRHDTYEAQPPICLHLESRLINVETSPSPINVCCIACLEGFVKDVVKMIMDTVLQPHWFGFRH